MCVVWAAGREFHRREEEWEQGRRGEGGKEEEIERGSDGVRWEKRGGVCIVWEE